MGFSRQSEGFKKKRLIWLEGLFVCVYVYLSVLLNVNMFVYVLSLAHLYIRIFPHLVAWIFIYIYIHKFLLSVVGKLRDKGRECEKGRVCEEGVGTELLQSKRFLFSLCLTF